MPATLREIQTSCPACHFAFLLRKVFPALDGFSFIPPDLPECKGMFTKLVLCPVSGIEVFLESNEHPVDLLWFAQVPNRIGDGLPIFQAKQRAELLGIKFVDAHSNVVSQHKFQERLLLARNLPFDRDLCPRRPFFPR